MKTGRLSPRSILFCARAVWQIFNPPRVALSPTEVGEGWPGGAAESFRVVSSADGVALSGWFLPSRGPHAVIVCHGLGQTSHGVVRQAELLRERGYHVVVFDLRGHGRSERRRRLTRMSRRYTDDLRSVVRFVEEDARIEGSLGVLALSFSTWTAVKLCALSDSVQALVCDSGPETSTGRALGNIIATQAALRLRATAARPALQALSSRLATWMIGEREWPPSRLDVPTLFVAGERDRVISLPEVQAFADRYTVARVWTARRASHVSSAKVDPEGYARAVGGHFDEHLAALRVDGRSAR